MRDPMPPGPPLAAAAAAELLLLLLLLQNGYFCGRCNSSRDAIRVSSPKAGPNGPPARAGGPLGPPAAAGGPLTR